MGLLAGAWIGLGFACAEPGGDGDCSPGTAGCECIAGACLGNLECVAGYCIEVGGDGDTGDTDPTDPTGDGDGDNPCDGGQSFCGGKCIDTQSNILNCGECGLACDSGDGCVDGACVPSCVDDPCAGFSFCDPDSQLCLPGCESDEQCGANEQCDLGTHACVCAEGSVLCGGVCIDENDACAEECGNGAVDPGEACDGNNLDGNDCTDFGWDGGTLGCQPDCSGFNQTSCTDVICGDGNLDPGEDCDGDILDGETCTSQGYLTGTLSCSNCSFDLGDCSDTAGDCCTPKQTPMCEIDEVWLCVCQANPSCCNNAWSNSCVDFATNFCWAYCE
jgi:hypothetical protein